MKRYGGEWEVFRSGAATAGKSAGGMGTRTRARQASEWNQAEQRLHQGSQILIRLGPLMVLSSYRGAISAVIYKKKSQNLRKCSFSFLC